ncbi:hypothetical protein BMH32_03855 [Leucobacter sp. OLJS4]|uniref:hypothetical protein n=1 Tax=unclassified Leucobacter TaxID=2621730 RepID=UPI000C177C98|nr:MULTISPECIES: hypothetical protein [unclassified Leucobacter]PII82825.1 hypothetical protein BMH25_08780 [Leucobacter sp. OLCALW19]PII88067.1 hypothetical protein BMH26_07320 [Leucobacter sp. OLTLW20]PII91925.1 hypothetical protein BMH27_07405 [Leucobacter sp. OLAS13]PIJ00247.1 hypothetical protein BMH29_02690 [Leucobacter sp. OLDS2]PIJ02840.1 hypothetical protein BMH28_04235 [Leucobacter sp. OLCS4]
MSPRSVPGGGSRARARAILARRATRSSDDGAVYRAYLVVMTLLVVVAPVLRAATLALADAWPRLGSAGAGVAGVAVCAVLVACALLGAQRGPASASLPEIDLVLSGPGSRARLLAPTVLRACAVSAALGAICGGMFGIATAPPAAWAPAIAVGGGLGLCAAAVLLAGQAGRGVRAALATGLVLLGAGVALLPNAWISTLAVAAAALGFASVAAAPAFAARIPLRTLRDQAARWEDVSMLALSGDPAIAAARLGAPVRVGRRWRWRVPRRAVPAILLRDLRGALRAPARSVLGVVALIGAGAGLALVTGGPGAPLGAVPDAESAALAGAGLGAGLYAALGPLCRGLGAAAEGIGGPGLLPLPPGRLLAAHAILPSALAILLPVLGAIIVGAAGWSGAGGAVGAEGAVGIAGPILLAVVALAAMGQQLRILAVLKGPLPQRLLAPIPTPAGDLSALNVLVWTFDGPVCAAVIGALLAALTVGAPQALLPVSLPILLGLGFWIRARYRTARGR